MLPYKIMNVYLNFVLIITHGITRYNFIWDTPIVD